MHLIFARAITFNFCCCCYNEGKKRTEGEAGRAYAYQSGWEMETSRIVKAGSL